MSFDWAPIEFICRENGLDVSLFRESNEDNVSSLLAMWYREHLRMGGERQEVVRQVEKEGKSPGQMTRDLGIAEQTLSNWRKAAKAGKLAVGKPVTPEW